MPMSLHRSGRMRSWHPVCTARSFENNAGLPAAHALALPPAWDTYPLPQCIRTAGRGRGRPVLWVGDGQAKAESLDWAQLLALSEQQPVIVSLESFCAALNRKASRLASMRVRQEKHKLTCGKVECTNFVTRGFALQDVFPLGWYDRQERMYVQRYLNYSARLREFCKRNTLVPLLTTETDSDTDSHHPLSLYREGRSGFLLAIDTAPPAGHEKATAISPYLDRLLAQAQGLVDPQRGQYAVSPRSHQEFQQILAQLNERFPLMRFVQTDGVRDEPPVGWVQLQRPRMPFAAAENSLQTLSIRTGFAKDEWDLVYGVLTYLKQVQRAATGRTPVLASLLSRFTLQWIPLASRPAVPPSTDEEYKYVLFVPARRRHLPVEYPKKADIRIDLRRNYEQVITIHASGGPVSADLRKRLTALSECLDLPVSLDLPRRGLASLGTNWELTFPVEPRPAFFDSITAVNRVVRTVGTILLGLSESNR